MTVAELIQVKFSGELSNSRLYFNLALQAIAVMIGGIILWKTFSSYHRKKVNERSNRKFFDTPYSKHWKR